MYVAGSMLCCVALIAVETRIMLSRYHTQPDPPAKKHTCYNGVHAVHNICLSVVLSVFLSLATLLSVLVLVISLSWDMKNCSAAGPSAVHISVIEESRSSFVNHLCLK